MSAFGAFPEITKSDDAAKILTPGFGS